MQIKLNYLGEESDSTNYLPPCDIILNMYLVFVPGFWHTIPKTQNLLSDKNIFCMLNGMTGG